MAPWVASSHSPCRKPGVPYLGREGPYPHPNALSGTVEAVGSRNQGVIASLSRLLSGRQTGQAGQCCGYSPPAIPGRLRMLGTRLVPTFNLSWSCFLLYSSALQMATRPGQDLGRWFMSSLHLTNDTAPRLGKWRDTTPKHQFICQLKICS